MDKGTIWALQSMNAVKDLEISHLESDLSLRNRPDFYSSYPRENLTAIELHESNYMNSGVVFWYCEIIGTTQESLCLGYLF